MPTPLRSRTQSATEPPPGTGDAELVRLAQATPHAFADLYLRYRDPVMNYCYYRLGDREESEDAASVIFIKALDHLPRFAWGVATLSAPGSFASRTTRSPIADRHRTRHPQSTSPASMPHGSRAPPVWRGEVGATPPPSRIFSIFGIFRQPCQNSCAETPSPYAQGQVPSTLWVWRRLG